MYRLLHQFGRVRCASEEAVVTKAVELGVGHIKYCIFIQYNDFGNKPHIDSVVSHTDD